MTTKAVGYVRVSTEEQALEGVSVEAQIASVKAYAALAGLELADVVVDAGVSGSTQMASREGGCRLLAQMKKAKDVRAVVATKLDRLFRNSVDALATTAAWDKAGIALHLIDLGGQSLNTSSPMGRFLLTLLAATAEMERGLIAERTRAALAHKRSKGEQVSSQPPMGYKHADGLIVADENEQEVIAKIKRLSALGYKSSKIAKCLNDAGVPARGKCWYANSVNAALAA